MQQPFSEYMREVKANPRVFQACVEKFFPASHIERLEKLAGDLYNGIGLTGNDRWIARFTQFERNSDGVFIVKYAADKTGKQGYRDGQFVNKEQYYLYNPITDEFKLSGTCTGIHSPPVVDRITEIHYGEMF